MSTLSSSSTLSAVEAAYDDGASYAEDNSVTKCRTFITAARILLRRLPEEFGTRHSTSKFRMDLIQKELEVAREWLNAHDTTDSSANGPSYTRVNLQDSRD